MVTKKTIAGKKAAKLKLRKQTVRALDVKNSSSVKGGAATGTACVKLQHKTV